MTNDSHYPTKTYVYPEIHYPDPTYTNIIRTKTVAFQYPVWENGQIVYKTGQYIVME